MPCAKNESAIRRLAARQGLRLIKSRSRTPDSLSHGGFMLADLATGVAVAGASPFPYSLSLDAAEAWLLAPVETVSR